jgi:hypothetical protein
VETAQAPKEKVVITAAAAIGINGCRLLQNCHMAFKRKQNQNREAKEGDVPLGVMSLINDQVERGASRFTLVGGAAAQAGLPLVRDRHDEAVAAVEAAARWSVNPNEANAGTAVRVVCEIIMTRKERLPRPELFAFLSALYAALVCSPDKAGGPAVFAVQNAVTAAAGRDIDLESAVMAALL